MVMHTGKRWFCTNRKCGCSIVVERGTARDGTNPRCSCGSVMKKEFRSPVLSYLEFLHFDPPLVAFKKIRSGISRGHYSASSFSSQSSSHTGRRSTHCSFRSPWLW